MINFPGGLNKDPKMPNMFIKDGVDAILSAFGRQRAYGGDRFEQIIEAVSQAEAMVQATVTQMGKIKANKELRPEIALEKMGALADAAQDQKKKDIQRIMYVAKEFGAKWTREALPKLPNTDNQAEQQTMIQALKGDIRMVLDAANVESFRQEYSKLVEFYQQRGNRLALWLLCGSDFIELYADTRKLAFTWTLADQWQAYKPFATDLQLEAADLAVLMHDFTLQPGGEKPFELRMAVTVPEAVVSIDRGFDYALGV